MASGWGVLRKQVTEGLGQLVAGLVIVAGGYAVNGLFGLTALQTGLLGLIFVTLTYIVVTSESELSFPFIASLVAVLLVVWQFVLDPVIGDAIPVEGWLAGLGIDITHLDALQVLFLVTVAIVLYWVVMIRAGSGARTAESVAERLENRVEGLFETYITIGRIAASVGVAVLYYLFSEGGVLAGEIGGYLSNAPLVASNIVTGILGYLSLGGSIPYLDSIPLLGSLAAGEFAVLVILILALAAGAKYS